MHKVHGNHEPIISRSAPELACAQSGADNAKRDTPLQAQNALQRSNILTPGGIVFASAPLPSLPNRNCLNQIWQTTKPIFNHALLSTFKASSQWPIQGGPVKTVFLSLF